MMLIYNTALCIVEYDWCMFVIHGHSFPTAPPG